MLISVCQHSVQAVEKALLSVHLKRVADRATCPPWFPCCSELTKMTANEEVT